MGLDTSHDCWHGSYGVFNAWREQLCLSAGLPPLSLMEGFYSADDISSPFFILKHAPEMIREPIERKVLAFLPIKWDALKPNALYKLLYHSDRDGEIEAVDCVPIADALTELLPKLPEGEHPGHIGNWRAKTQQFIDGLRAAAFKNENVEFH
jgi:hypothetical protein